MKFNTDGKNPVYKAILECPKGKQLFVHFDYSYTTKNYWPLEVIYDGKSKGAKLAWYTKDVENTTVDRFLDKIAKRINKKYGYELKE
ncbi:hypothetical protein J2S74_005300 [Evansella vedderi]|uniref:Transposase n=1 Tax=Evansella vedderi TaxID=38282 RepID=A0ABU0A2X0_9BACI|nr:hypothetical protein [Evansella vedderi]